MALHTPLCSALDVEHPIVQAPIGSVSSPELAAAVSNAGALGSLAVTWRNHEETRGAVSETRSLTDGQFAVNLVLDDAARQRPTDEHLDTCLDAGAPVVSLSFGDPSPYVEQVHDAGATLLATVGSAADAEQAAEAGVDAVVAQGWEAGGHVQSDVATMALVPSVAAAVEVPVIAAGGIGDGRGVAAALALGADGAWLGTRFVATEEANAHERYKRRLTDASATDTHRGDVFSKGWPDQPHRTLDNETVERADAGADEPDADVIAHTDGEPIERYTDDPPLSGTDGAVEAMAEYAGQSVGRTRRIEPAAAVVERLVADAEATIDDLDGLRS
jgi:nitronate monooxygenase